MDGGQSIPAVATTTGCIKTFMHRTIGRGMEQLCTGMYPPLLGQSAKDILGEKEFDAGYYMVGIKGNKVYMGNRLGPMVTQEQGGP